MIMNPIKPGHMHPKQQTRLSTVPGVLQVILSPFDIVQARIQEKLKHSEEKLEAERESNYQKVKASEESQRKLEGEITATRNNLAESQTQLTETKSCLAELSSDREKTVNKSNLVFTTISVRRQYSSTVNMAV